ncbi:MAG: hypothetical protein ABI818_09620 [Acidobacteriota bacterium]
MDVVTLPLVYSQAPVAQALELLRQYQRAGVVRYADNDTYELLFAGNLLRARAAGKTTVGEVEGGRRILIADAPIAREFHIDAVRPHRTYQQVEQMLDARGAQYALIAAANAEVMIITRHEGLKEMLSATGGFECDGTPTHYFPEPDVALGQKCPLIPECSRPDGNPPTIQVA